MRRGYIKRLGVFTVLTCLLTGCAGRQTQQNQLLPQGTQQGEAQKILPDGQGEKQEKNLEGQGEVQEKNPEGQGEVQEKNPEGQGEVQEKNPERQGEKQEKNPERQGEKQEKNPKEQQNEIREENIADNVKLITPQTVVTEIEDGLSIVRFEGEDGFSAFLENGGASSDAGVMEYLTESMLNRAGGIQMEGNPFGCSTISARNENGEILFGRNFDWYPCEALIAVSYPENAYASVSTVNTSFITQGAGMGVALSDNDSILTVAALYAPLDGMNEQGLCVSVNMIEDSDTIEQDTEKPDITTTTAVRLLLNNAADVDEAVRLLEAYDLHASFGYMVHFALSDAKGNHTAVEYVDNEMVVTQTPVVTNFYLAEGEKHGIGTSQSHERYELLMEILEGQETLSEQEVKDALERVSKHHYNDGETTEWSIIYNQTAREAVYFHREDYTQAYRIQM